jgi:hypothetical protein
MNIPINPEALLQLLYNAYTPNKYIEVCHTSEACFDSVYHLCRQLKKDGLIEYTVPFGGMIFLKLDGARTCIPPSEGFLCARLTAFGWQYVETENKKLAKQKLERLMKIFGILIALGSLILTVLLRLLDRL